MSIAETLYVHRLAKSASGERDYNFFCTCFKWSTMTANTSGHAHQEWIHHIDSVLNEAFTITSKPVPSCNRLDVTEWMLKRGWYSVSRGPAGEMWSHLSDQFRCLAVPFLFEAEHEAMVIDRLRVWEGYNSNDEVRLSIARLAAFNQEAIK